VAHEQVPALTQYASPDLISAFVYDDRDPGEDPQWPLSGAVDVAEYRKWCWRSCGVSCLQMILQHRDGSAPALMSLLRAARQLGAYVEEDDGSVTGMIYAPFVEYIAAEFGLTGRVHPRLPIDQLLAELRSPAEPGLPAEPRAGRMLIASVHREIRRPELPSPGRGGHLVLVTGHDPVLGTITFNNPSGHTAESRTPTLPIAVFETFYAGRAVSVRLTG
jgi:hypothetical protein